MFGALSFGAIVCRISMVRIDVNGKWVNRGEGCLSYKALGVEKVRMNYYRKEAISIGNR